ncbi:hypothetical protein TCDM_10960 [Trypanosoma cruzi Dm28c]|uniref:Uncharacterized protein n=1 Tax=Trypanosoma cruzi Dm28c TaxID=1416333 RepID=V5B623_TRYCR|nr:hypothetical protein TCDM_10960 [Trypanosoma cruzi Dm28c]
MRSRHPRRSSNQRQHQKQRRTHSRNGPAPHTLPAARTRTHRRPHPPTQTGTNRALVVCRSSRVDHSTFLINPFLLMANPVTRFRQIDIPVLPILRLQVTPNTLKR